MCSPRPPGAAATPTLPLASPRCQTPRVSIRAPARGVRPLPGKEEPDQGAQSQRRAALSDWCLLISNKEQDEAEHGVEFLLLWGENKVSTSWTGPPGGHQSPPVKVALAPPWDRPRIERPPPGRSPEA